MLELVCLLVSLAIFISFYLFLSLRGVGTVLYAFLTASVLTCAQIILSELFLGLIHQLYLSGLIFLNLSLAAIVMAAGRRFRRRDIAAPLAEALTGARTIAGAAMDGHVKVLGLLAAATYAWVLTAAYFLPPRGIDDLAYHLPTIFEYVRSHEIRLLPTSMCSTFAFPENAELLFMWPVMFTHDQRWVDGVNVPFVLLSVMGSYALLRQFGIREKDSLFAALLYALCPVVIMQAGVSYVDIIVALFLLLSLYYSILFHEHGRTPDLFMAGLSIGLMCGMKYTAILLAMPLQALILPALWQGKRRRWFGYAAVIIVTAGWWYVRNAVVLGDPFYPMQELASRPRAVRGTQGGSMVENFLYNLPFWITRYPLADSGVGSYDGGFGLIFWGMGFSSWMYVVGRSFFAAGRTKLSFIVTMAYLPLGFAILLILPPQWIDVDGRLAMFIVVIGLYAFCEVLRLMRDDGYVAIIKTSCILLSLITVSLMSVTFRPSYRLTNAVSHAVRGVEGSEYRYLAEALEPHAVLGPAWELLDLLSRDDGQGLNCAIASDTVVQWPSPVYGTRLQNCVLNMHPERQRSVAADAYVGTFAEATAAEHAVSTGREEPQGSMTLGDAFLREDYVPVVLTRYAGLLLNKKVFEDPARKRILQSYYRSHWPEAVNAAELLDGKLSEFIPIITSSEIGYGIRSVEMDKGRPDRVYLVPNGREWKIATQKGLQQCYTVRNPLTGYRSRKITVVLYKGKNLDVFLNWRS